MFSNISRTCEEHNRMFRQVMYNRIGDASGFLANSRGNLLITGGEYKNRADILENLIVLSNRTQNEPVIIFSSDTQLECKLINLAQNGQLRNLFVCSQNYKTYDLFCGMSNNRITEFFSNLALNMGYRDTSRLSDYVGAFLNVLQTQCSINLGTMLEFAKNTDADIASVAQSNQQFNDYDILTSSAEGGVNFRRILDSVSKTFSTITTNNCQTGFSITTASMMHCVIYIDTSTSDFEIMSQFFATELKSLCGRRFTLILNDCLLLNNEDMQKAVSLLKQSVGSTVVLSYENITAVSDVEQLTNFSRHIIFLDGVMPSNDLQKVLSKSFGTYIHFQPATGSSEPNLIAMPWDKTVSKNIMQYERDRVIVEEEYGRQAVLKGDYGTTITIVNNIRI